MAKVKGKYTKNEKTTTTVTYYQKKGSQNTGKCPVCGKFMGKKGK